MKKIAVRTKLDFLLPVCKINHTDNKQIPKNPDLELKGAPEYLDGIKRDIKDSVKTVLSEI